MDIKRQEGEKIPNVKPAVRPQQVLFAQTPNPSMIIGVVSDSEPSSLALLAAGVAGMAARRARRDARIKFWEAQKTQT